MLKEMGLSAYGEMILWADRGRPKKTNNVVSFLNDIGISDIDSYLALL